jgi:hypothetical protein
MYNYASSRCLVLRYNIDRVTSCKPAEQKRREECQFHTTRVFWFHGIPALQPPMPTCVMPQRRPDEFLLKSHIPPMLLLEDFGKGWALLIAKGQRCVISRLR